MELLITRNKRSEPFTSFVDFFHRVKGTFARCLIDFLHKYSCIKGLIEIIGLEAKIVAQPLATALVIAVICCSNVHHGYYQHH